MSGDELNPAAVAQPVEDVQGDGRWMSQVGVIYWSISRKLKKKNPHATEKRFTSFIKGFVSLLVCVCILRVYEIIRPRRAIRIYIIQIKA